ncbi:hypothetical protein KPY62_08855 [Psychrobacter sp. TAE2020]|uniref:hypothetical protein n=1 Tax=Psychrobacter sp. TAE2020 TaxID=2846762 RepID=UPI001C1297B3|nr:hypothetical protein [Psychrobacter sp. TAE2020]MBU5617194.1 hypothetical protein [Psychrobacter sp. TAE2020]
MTWIIDNKEWLFSGAALGVIGLLIRLFKKSSPSSVNEQVQRGGHNSTNIQVGGSLNIRDKKDDE